MFKKDNDKQVCEKKETARISKNSVYLLVALIVCTVVVCGVYRMMIGTPNFKYLFYAYLAIETVFIFAYVIYNRGFSRKNVTADMLPSDWSEEQKNEFIENGKARFKRSRWMLIPIFAFFFTFAVDVIELFVLPSVFDLLGI